MAISPEDRKRFEEAGLESVRLDYVAGGHRVVHGEGRLDSERLAAKEWMAETEAKNARRETFRYGLMVVLTALAAFGALIAAAPVICSWISN